MLRVLHVIGGLARGGTESALMNFYRQIDRSVIQFDFISHHPELNDYEKEIKNLGGHIFYVPHYNGANTLHYIQAWEIFFETHPDYRIIHAHIWSTASLFLPIAKKAGLYTIMHSHSVNARKGIPALGRIILKQPLRSIPDYYIACSTNAAEWLFGKTVFSKENFKVLPNAIDPAIYRSNSKIRERVRVENRVHSKIIIGHIGTFDYNKNQEFIVDIFEKIHENHADVVLWLIGDGVGMKSLSRKVSGKSFSADVFFWGVREDIPELLQAMDIFLFPSSFESFGNVALEAQAAGLPVLCSTGVPKSVAATDLIEYLPLDQPGAWIDRIEKLIADRTEHRDEFNILRNTKYDVAVVTRWLQDFYLSRI